MRLLLIGKDEINDPAWMSCFTSLDARVERAAGAMTGLSLLRNSGYDLAVLCFPLPDWRPEELLEEVQRIDRHLPVLIYDERGATSDAVRLIKMGAFHYFSGQPAAGERDDHDAPSLREVLAAALDQRRRSLGLAVEGEEESWRSFLVGESRAMQSAIEVIRLVASRRCTVLISGETGTGKEVVARAIHAAGSRAAMPWVAVNCSALPEALLEAELFGHVRGAFTGAVQNRVGRFEQAHRGTMFLDEIGEMPLELQAKLLRVLQERELQRVGSSETVRIDARIIAATNLDLEDRVERGLFREDLYYRLNVVPLRIAPLRERSRDVVPLTSHFIAKICRQEGVAVKQITAEALARLCRYAWPGNVRQLENAIERAIALSGDRDVLVPGDFALPSSAPPKPPRGEFPVIALPEEGLDFEATVGGIERAILEQALNRTGGNKKLAADILRLKRTTLVAKLKSLKSEWPARQAQHARAAG